MVRVLAAHANALRLGWDTDDALGSEKVVTLIPYYGEGRRRGQAQSSTLARRAFLDSTVYAAARYFPRVAIGTCTPQDRDFVIERYTHMARPPRVVELDDRLKVPQSLAMALMNYACVVGYC